MRGLLVLVGTLCVWASTSAAQPGKAQDFKADEKRILECLQAAQIVRTEPRVCIGRETNLCESTTARDFSYFKAMYCAAAEAEAWKHLMEKAYSSLVDRYAKYDEESKMQAGFQPVAPAMKQAHESWERWSGDCELERIRAGQGTGRFDYPARYDRDRIAERALLYRKWLD